MRHQNGATTLVWTLIFAECVRNSAGTSGGTGFLCSTQCCSAQPSCGTPTHVTCKGCDLLTLKHGFLPWTTESLEIVGGQEIVVARQMSYGLPRLINITVRGANTVHIGQRGLQMGQYRSLFRLHIDRVNLLTLHSEALSGMWGSDARIHFNNIDVLILYPRAVSLGASQSGPRLELARVAKLTYGTPGLHTDAVVKATLSELRLTDVAMETCYFNTFSGQVNAMVMEDSNLQQVNSQCVNAGTQWQRLLVKNTRVRNMEEYSFHGSIKQVVLQDCNITTLHTRAIFLTNTDSLTVQHCQFTNFHSEAMDITSKNITILHNNVTYLRKRALARLKLAGSSRQNRLVVKSLNAQNAESGSLALNPETYRSLNQVEVGDITFRINCSCQADTWVEQVVVGNTFPSEEAAFFAKVYNASFCLGESGRLTRLADYVERCEAGRRTELLIPTHSPDTRPSSRDQRVVFCTVIVTVLLLLTGLAALLVIKRHRLTAHLDKYLTEHGRPAGGGSRLTSPLFHSTSGDSVPVTDTVRYVPPVIEPIQQPSSVPTPQAGEHLYAEIPAAAEISDVQPIYALPQDAVDPPPVPSAPPKPVYAVVNKRGIQPDSRQPQNTPQKPVNAADDEDMTQPEGSQSQNTPQKPVYATVNKHKTQPEGNQPQNTPQKPVHAAVNEHKTQPEGSQSQNTSQKPVYAVVNKQRTQPEGSQSQNIPQNHVNVNVEHETQPEGSLPQNTQQKPVFVIVNEPTAQSEGTQPQNTARISAHAAVNELKTPPEKRKFQNSSQRPVYAAVNKRKAVPHGSALQTSVCAPHAEEMTENKLYASLHNPEARALHYCETATIPISQL